MTSTRQRLRPQVYVHFEFGLSLGGNQPPPHHEMTYRSRGLRERSPSFPRAVPALNTNFLSTSTHHTQQAPNQGRGRQPYNYFGSPPNPTRQQEPIYYYGGPPVEPAQQRIYYYGGPTRQIEQAQNDVPKRPSREERSRDRWHERGISAPPPFGDNPWDVNIHQPAGAATLFSPSQQPTDTWKALPEVPSRYRLGEDDLPWDAWSVPHGYDPDAHPQDGDEPSSSKAPPTNPTATSLTDVSTFSPGPTGPSYRPDDPGRIKELAGLSSAMMTVDNGFENQWWYQGEREAVPASPTEPRFSRRSLGWAVASSPHVMERHVSLAGSIVSPETVYTDRSETPVPSLRG